MFYNSQLLSEITDMVVDLFLEKWMMPHELGGDSKKIVGGSAKSSQRE